MSLNIDKKEMDQAWINRHNSEKFYEYIYDIAKYQVSVKGVKNSDREDYVQFCVYKCFRHVDSYCLDKGAAYSFFWKQIALSIIWKQRKEAQRKQIGDVFYVDNEKIMDWIEFHQSNDEGISFKDIVDIEELVILRAAFKQYNVKHPAPRLKPNKDNTITVLKYKISNYPDFLDNFTKLKPIFINWLKETNDVDITA